MPDPSISRRDFLNGALMAAGGLAVTRSAPTHVLAAQTGGARCDGPIGLDPRALRGGNLPRAFNVAHWMRDRRLAFSRTAVTLAKGCDAESGTFAIREDGGAYDVVIAGAGVSGLSTAFYLLRRRPGTRILMLDANSEFGGNARRDDEPPLPVMASTAGSYCVAPYADFQRTLYSAIGLEWERYKVAAPFYSYYFDDRTPGVRPGHRGWHLDAYGKGVADLPYASEIVRQLLKCKGEFAAWYSRDGSPTDPPAASDPKFDYLSRMTLHDYLVRDLGCDPLVSDFYTRYTIDALGGTAKQVNAHSSICFLAGEYAEPFAFPGGNAGLARLMVKWLIKNAIAGDAVTSPVNAEALDRVENTVRIRQDALVLRADQDGLVYHRDGQFYRAKAKAIVLAGGSHTSQRVVEHLADRRRKDAWKTFNTVPVVVANVAVTSAAPFVDAGFGYNQYWWGSKYWADFVIADWATPRRTERDRGTVLTFFGGNTAGPDELASERFKLLDTPFGDYERSIRDDLARIMAGTAFDVDRDVSAIYLYRWGHAMIMPVPGQLFGTGPDRKASPRSAAVAPLGSISFAGQETEGTPSVECAIASGDRAATEALKHL
jgi:spermidine dehydrogenase